MVGSKTHSMGSTSKVLQNTKRVMLYLKDNGTEWMLKTRISKDNLINITQIDPILNFLTFVGLIETAKLGKSKETTTYRFKR